MEWEHGNGHLCKMRPSPGDCASLLKEVRFDMGPKADRNSPEEEGERDSRQSCWVLYRRVGWRVKSQEALFQKRLLE